MVSPRLAAFFKYTLWLLHVRVQTVVFWLLFLATAWWGWDYYGSIGIVGSNRVIAAFFLGLIPSLFFKGLSFFLLAFLDFALVVTPSLVVDLKFPLEKVSARLERTLTDRGVPHFPIASFTLAGLEQLFLRILRVQFKANLPYNVVVTNPFLVVRALEERPAPVELRLSKALRAVGASSKEPVTRVTVLNEDSLEGRSLAKVLETNLRLF